MTLITNLTSIQTNSKYIERYMELNFEVDELSCFDLTSKQLNLLAYIGRTSDNQGSKRIDENQEESKSLKFMQITLKWRSELARS